MKKKREVNYRPKRRRGTTLIPLVTLTVLVAILSAALAGAWQFFDPVEYVTPQMVAEQTAPRLSKPEPEPEPEPASKAAEPSSAAESEPPPENQDISQYQVPKGEWAGTGYFNDALFVGDSITDGIKVYDVMSNSTVLAYTGINLDNIFTKQVVKNGDSEDKLTIIEAARQQSPTKVYVMMGANSMSYDMETFVKAYGRLVDELSAMHPQAVVYVQSILPVTATYEKNRPEFANAKIDEYNLALRQMAKDKGLPFLNVAEVFKDENGALPTEASPKDGMHFSKSWYEKWFDYLRYHVITINGQ